MSAVWIKIESTKPGRKKKFKKIRSDGGRAVMLKIAKLPSDISTDIKTPLEKKVKLIKKESNNKELEKHVNNLTTIMSCSNATELDRNTRGMFKCPHCDVVVEKPDMLKTHILDTHDNVEPNMKSRSTMNQFYAKLDITGLTCKICSEKCNKLQGLTAHLESAHQIQMHKTLRNLMFEFDFSDGFTCTVCSNNFMTYKALSEHMNIHFKYYVCEVCNHGFATPSRLMAHKDRHKTGEFKCKHCKEVFETVWKRTDHINKVHMARRARFKCPYCPKRFVSYLERKTHSIAEHGKEIVPQLKCSACDQVFLYASGLSRHKRKDHLLERQHGCDICSMSFFTKAMLTDHMIKHTGEREFQCSVCLKTYCRKRSLREHMRIHADERRFACAHCGQQFVQKCSWKSHMRSKHDEAVE